MKIEHIAIWCKNLELMKIFYEHYFDAISTVMYINQKSGFLSYSLTLLDGAQIKLMKMDSIEVLSVEAYKQFIGFAHIAFKAGSIERVNEIITRFASEGMEVLIEPHWTENGYYESVFLDPEGNHLKVIA